MNPWEQQRESGRIVISVTGIIKGIMKVIKWIKKR